MDSDPVRAARDLADQHITKMLLESSQLLASAHHLSGSPMPESFPKLTHQNHPCSKWTRASIHNYRWLARHAVAISEEFERRYRHPHSWVNIIRWLSVNEPSLPDMPFSEPPQAMPDACKVEGDCVLAYRRYYKMEKSSFARWMYSPLPEWW